MARCVILSACPVSPALAGLLREDDFIIACDAGYRNCVPLHCKPHVIVGDFDTAPCPQQEDDEIVVLPHVKDDTDTEYAAKLAVQKGFDEVLLLGGLGGRRLEHTLANLCTGLGLEKRGVRATLQDVHVNNYKVVIEGVETLHYVSWLKDMPWFALQGYLWPEKRIDELITTPQRVKTEITL